MTGRPPAFGQKSAATPLVLGGFKPLLFTVVNGSYNSNLVFGSGAAQLNSYQMFQLPRGTTTVPFVGPSFVTSTEGCDYQLEEREINFTCSVVLNAQLPDPAFGDEELRIKPFPRLTTEPPQFLKPLPIPLRTAPLPFFDDVEIVNKAGIQIAPDVGSTTGVYILQARLLQDGTLALVLKDITTAPPTVRGFQHDDFDSAFGTLNEIIRIIIRGSYKAQQPAGL